MRTSFLLGFTAVLVVLMATCSIAQDAGALTFDKYGLSLSLPTPYERMSMQLPPISGLVEVYKSNNLVYVVIATDDVQPKNATARQALNMVTSVMSQMAAKVPDMGLHTLNGASAQGVTAVGFGARVGAQAINAKAKSAMDYATQMPPELRQMYGNDIYQAVLLMPFTESGRMVAGIAVVGPGDQQQAIDAAAMRVMSTVSVGKPNASPKASAANTAPSGPAPAAVKTINDLKKGQIELIGTVSSVDKSAKALSMMVSQVTSYGQPIVVLDPARLKNVYFKSLPADTKEGSSIVVVAVDSGVGKPVKAVSLKTIATDTK